jgi:hypothetical protein
LAPVAAGRPGAASCLVATYAPPAAAAMHATASRANAAGFDNMGDTSTTIPTKQLPFRAVYLRNSADSWGSPAN